MVYQANIDSLNKRLKALRQARGRRVKGRFKGSFYSYERRVECINSAGRLKLFALIKENNSISIESIYGT